MHNIITHIADSNPSDEFTPLNKSLNKFII